jgi:hypothetical protein
MSPVSSDLSHEERVAKHERDWRANEAEIAVICGHLHAQSARLVEAVAAAMQGGWWSGPGIVSEAHWVQWQTGLSPNRAREVVTIAARWSEFPQVTAAFLAGELSHDQVLVIARHAPAWVDGQIVPLAQAATVGQLRSLLSRYPFDDPSLPPPQTPLSEADGPTADTTKDAGETCADPDVPDGPDPLAPAHGLGDRVHASDAEPDPHCAGLEGPDPRAEFLRLTQRDDGMWTLSGRLDADHGLIVDAALRELTDAMFRDLGRMPGGGEILVELANHSLDRVEERSRRDRFRVHVQIDERHQLVDPLGRRLPAWVRDLIGCDADGSLVWTRDARPIAVGSTAPTIEPAVRRYVLARDHGCRVPACGATRRLDLHHVVHREHGGTNDVDNLVTLCPMHHRAHHRGHLTIRGNPDVPIGDPAGLEFRNRHGVVIRPNRLVEPPSGPPDPPSGRYEHPAGEPMDTRWIEFIPPPTFRDPPGTLAS